MAEVLGEPICQHCIKSQEQEMAVMLLALRQADPELAERADGLSENPAFRTAAETAMAILVTDPVTGQPLPLEDMPPLPRDLAAQISAARKGGDKRAIRTVPSPRQIKEFLDQYVVGQDETKKVLSVAVHNHYKRIEEEERREARDKAAAGGRHGKQPPSSAPEPEDPEFADVELEKSNILLVGPTGSGKTLLARTLARMLDVPFAIADATTLTEAGYVGEDVENILLNLIQAAGMDIKRAEKGIVFVDEIDKIARKTGNVSITRDVSGEGVQQALLKIVEGTLARVPPAGGRKHPEQRYIEIRTKNILFICGGAFVGLDKIIERRSADRHFGFARIAEDGEEGGSQSESGSPVRRRDARPEPEDFIEFGLIPEFVGRLPVVSTLSELTEDELVHVLTEPRNALCRQYRKVFRMEGVDLRFSPDAIREIAKEALRRKTGARGLRAILEDLMTDLMFEIGTSSEKPATSLRTLVLSADDVRAGLSGKGPGLAAALR